MLQIGTVAPGFTLYDSEKKERSLSEFLVAGKKTIVAFYPGAFTGTCTQELCTFRDMFSELQAMNALLVGISVDGPFAQKAFAEKYGFGFPLLCDFQREVVRKYDVVWNDLGGVKGYQTANRAIYILGSDGKITFSWVASAPGVLPDFAEIKKNL